MVNNFHVVLNMDLQISVRQDLFFGIDSRRRSISGYFRSFLCSQIRLLLYVWFQLLDLNRRDAGFSVSHCYCFLLDLDPGLWCCLSVKIKIIVCYFKYYIRVWSM
jgi:hypothetical protein